MLSSSAMVSWSKERNREKMSSGEREKRKIELIELVSHVVGPTVHFLEVVSYLKWSSESILAFLQAQ